MSKVLSVCRYACSFLMEDYLFESEFNIVSCNTFESRKQHLFHNNVFCYNYAPNRGPLSCILFVYTESKKQTPFSASILFNRTVVFSPNKPRLIRHLVKLNWLKTKKKVITSKSNRVFFKSTIALFSLFSLDYYMLPVHRTMKNGERDFYSDDKYDKLHGNKDNKVNRIKVY